MAYEDLRDQVLSNYGGQDNVPDSVYNALYKYKTQGQDALDDREYSILAQEKEKPLPEVDKNAESAYTFYGFANPLTEANAQKYARENPVEDDYKVDQFAGHSARGPQNGYQSPWNELISDFSRKPKTSGYDATIKPIGEFARENPGTTAAGAVTLGLPLSIPGAIGAGLVGGAGYAIDKFHPLTSQVSDYQVLPTRENVVDIAGGTAGAGMLHGAGSLFAKALRGISGPIVRQYEAYPGKMAEWEENMLDARFAHEENQDALRDIASRVRREAVGLNDPLTEEQMLGTLPNTDYRKAFPSAGDVTAEAELVARAKLQAIKEHMLVYHPEYGRTGKLNQIFKNQLVPSDIEAARYYEQISAPFEPMEAPAKPVGLNMLQWSPKLNAYANTAEKAGAKLGALTNNFFVPRALDYIGNSNMMAIPSAVIPGGIREILRRSRQAQ